MSYFLARGVLRSRVKICWEEGNSGYGSLLSGSRGKILDLYAEGDGGPLMWVCTDCSSTQFLQFCSCNKSYSSFVLFFREHYCKSYLAFVLGKLFTCCRAFKSADGIIGLFSYHDAVKTLLKCYFQALC